MEHRGTLGGKREELRSLLHFAEQSKSSLKIWAEWGIDSHFSNSFLERAGAGQGGRKGWMKAAVPYCSLPLLTCDSLPSTVYQLSTILRWGGDRGEQKAMTERQTI